MDAYLSPEMKSTGEAIGYDDTLNRALYKALQASGMKRGQDYGTVFVTIADEDKEEALPLIRRFYRLGFNIEATAGTARFPEANTASAPACGRRSARAATRFCESHPAGATSPMSSTRSAMLSGDTHRQRRLC